MPELDFSKYERARIIGARALQIAMNAPLLLKISEEDLEAVHYDALKIAEIELNSGVLPISIKKPFPQKKEEYLKRPPVKKVSDKETEEMETKEEEEIVKEGEIMKIADQDRDEEESNEDSNDEEA